MQRLRLRCARRGVGTGLISTSYLWGETIHFSDLSEAKDVECEDGG